MLGELVVGMGRASDILTIDGHDPRFFVRLRVARTVLENVGREEFQVGDEVSPVRPHVPRELRRERHVH